MRLTAFALLSLYLVALLPLHGPSRVHVAGASDNGVSSFYQAFTRNADHDPKAGAFKIVGGFGISPPCCTSHGNGRMDCFRIDPDSKIYHITKENGVYGKWQEIASVQSTELECVSRQSGIIDILSRNANSQIVSKTYTGGKWTPNWTVTYTNGRFIEVPSCTSRTPALVECMTRGFNNQAYYFKQENGKWSSNYVALKGTLNSPMACASRSPVDIDCFGVGTDSGIWQRCWNPKRGWRVWFNMGGITQGKPKIITWPENDSVGIFALERTNGLTYKVYHRSSGWHQWLPLGGKFESVPQCVTIGTDKIHCFGIGEKSYLYRLSFDGKKWGTWTPAYGSLLKGLACVITDRSKEEVTCMLRGFDRSFVEVVYTLK